MSLQVLVAFVVRYNWLFDIIFGVWKEWGKSLVNAEEIWRDYYLVQHRHQIVRFRALKSRILRQTWNPAKTKNHEKCLSLIFVPNSNDRNGRKRDWA